MVSKGKFYVWSSFDPHTTRVAHGVKQMTSSFKLYTDRLTLISQNLNCVSSLCSPMTQTYGALLDSREVGDSSVHWTSQDPSAHQLTGVFCGHTPMSIWTSREHQKARYLALAMEETASMEKKQERWILRTQFLNSQSNPRGISRCLGKR